MKMIDTGYSNYISTDRIVAIVNPESAPIKRMIQDSKDRGTAVDATYGRKTRSVIVMDSGQVVLSPMKPETLMNRTESM